MRTSTLASTVMTFTLNDEELANATPYELQVLALAARPNQPARPVYSSGASTPLHKLNTDMHHNRSKYAQEEANKDLSAVEYIFEQLTEQPRQWSDDPEANVYNEGDARMCVVKGGWNEQLLSYSPQRVAKGFEVVSLDELAQASSERLEEGWQIVQLSQLIAVTMAELLQQRAFDTAIQTAQRWQVSLFHESLAFSAKELADVQTALELLQGVIQAAKTAAKGTPCLWWEGKRASVNDPRMKVGQWLPIKNNAGRAHEIRRVSTLACEVKDCATGKTTYYCNADLKPDEEGNKLFHRVA